MNHQKCECHLCTQSRISQFERAFLSSPNYGNKTENLDREAAIQKMVEALEFYANEMMAKSCWDNSLAKRTLEAWNKVNK